MGTFEEKNAAFADALKMMGREAGSGAVRGLGAAASGAAVAGIGIAASKLYDAATKARDFRQMLEANPDLKEHQQSMPVHFNRAYTSLRDMVPQFAKDPLVAGRYMRMMVENPNQAGGYVVDALRDSPKFEHPIQESFNRAGLEGVKSKQPGPDPLQQALRFKR